jgi:glycosyltransferase involved in cell wall biosynthesis
LRQAHGAAARARAIEQFHIEDCARAYLDLFAEREANSLSRPR